MGGWGITTAILAGLTIAILLTYPKNEFSVVDRKLLFERSFSATLRPYVDEYHLNRNRLPATFKELTTVYPELEKIPHREGFRVEDVQFFWLEPNVLKVVVRDEDAAN